MKKILLVLALLIPTVLQAGEKREVIISPEVFAFKKSNIDSEHKQIDKNVIGNGVKILFEARDAFIDDTELGVGTGIRYNTLKVKGSGINSNSGHMISVPMYFTVGGATNNGIYTKLSLGFALQTGKVKWTDNRGGTGEIKLPKFGLYAAFGAGYRKDRFSVGVSASTSAKGKRTYTYSNGNHFSDKLGLSNAVLSVDFGYAFKN